jgi:hypothetical protein
MMNAITLLSRTDLAIGIPVVSTLRSSNLIELVAGQDTFCILFRVDGMHRAKDRLPHVEEGL